MWIYIYIYVYIYIYDTFLCSFADFDNNGTNSWKNTKLCEKMFHHLKKSETNFECFRLFVLELLGLRTHLFYCRALLPALTKTERTIAKTNKLWISNFSSFNKPEPKFQCLSCFVLLGLKFCYTLMWFLKMVHVKIF